MFLRLITVTALCGLPFVNGCSTPSGYDGTGPAPPKFKMHNAKRLVKETAWFYADLQDTLFGVDHYADLENQYGAGPYE